MRTAPEQIIAAIRATHGEITLPPSDLLALVAEIDRLEAERARWSKSWEMIRD